MNTAKNQNNVTLPAIPAALKKIHRPTLVLKMPVEIQEDRQKEERDRGRYSIVVPREEKVI